MDFLQQLRIGTRLMKRVIGFQKMQHRIHSFFSSEVTFGEAGVVIGICLEIL
ncbi:hypothetical protein SDC9_132148 [bioreactor metagenome]|jgi:hypothetical protein|uniref:Uncharacterized protein n=1 Tax=bioreactor metagenome TaxID=1076179 RepID=A0A645D745_9ZZZZ